MLLVDLLAEEDVDFAVLSILEAAAGDEQLWIQLDLWVGVGVRWRANLIVGVACGIEGWRRSIPRRWCEEELALKLWRVLDDVVEEGASAHADENVAAREEKEDVLHDFDDEKRSRHTVCWRAHRCERRLGDDAGKMRGDDNG